MKQLASNYSISGAAVTLSGVNVPLSQILLVSDATTGNVLYSMAGPAASSYTQAANSVITLASTPGASDKLTIYYDDGVAVTNGPTSVSVSNFPSTQAVSGTVTANTGLSQPLTDTQLRASAVPVSGTFYQATQPVSLASVPSHPVTNAGTFAVQPSAGDLTSGSQTTKIVNGANTLAVDSAGALTSNNAASQVYNYTATGAISANTVLIGPIDCTLFREVSIHCTAIGTSGSFILQLSNDNSNWATSSYVTPTGSINASVSTAGFTNYPLQNAKYFRVIQNTAQTSGTTTLVAYASQQATPKLYQSVTVSGTASVSPQVSTAGFSTYHALVSAATTNATSVKNAAGAIGSLILTNSSATWAYFKLVNKASAPTVGTDTAVINIGVAPNTTLDCSSSYAGLRMAAGIAYYVSGGSSLTDNTALGAAGTFLVNMTYA